MTSTDLFKKILQGQRRKMGDPLMPLKNLLEMCVEELEPVRRETLTSKVNHKEYFCFHDGTFKSRCVNSHLYRDEFALDHLHGLIHKPFSGDLNSLEITQCLYTCTMLFCCANDIRKKNDQKTPGTFFEYLMKTVMCAHLHCEGTRSLPVLNMDGEASLPTDLIFDLGAKKPKFHIPVKTSTRERVIQVWAHQRVIDGAYGVGRFLGFPIVLTETKLDSNTREVTEICLPNQWLLYQLFIAQLWGIAYVDIPEKYQNLNTGFPIIRVYTLGDYLVRGGILEKFVKGLVV